MNKKEYGSILITNANIFTMSSTLPFEIKKGFILIEDGKIKRVAESEFQGNDLPGYEILDAKGGMVFPGFVDGHCHLGMWEDGLGFEGDDGNEDTDPSTPHMRAVDAINPSDNCFREALESGVTTVITGPGSANPIGGQLCAMKTYGRLIDDMLVKAPLAMKMALGENPKTTYNGKNQSPVTRMATAGIIREQLHQAKRYFNDLTLASKDSEIDEPEYDAKCEALLPVIEGKLPVHFHAHRLDDIFTAARIAEEFSLNYIIVHGTQAHLAADLIAEKEIKILCGPILCDRAKPEMRDLTPTNPRILHEAGVPISIITDHPVIPAQYLALCASLAVREGLSWEEGMKAITINPAKICEIADRVGSIDVGKDGDIVIFEGDPLNISSKPKTVIINGKKVFS